MPHAYTEDQLVEQPAIGLFAELGWQSVSALEEVFGIGGLATGQTTACAPLSAAFTPRPRRDATGHNPFSGTHSARPNHQRKLAKISGSLSPFSFSAFCSPPPLFPPSALPSPNSESSIRYLPSSSCLAPRSATP
jgi:hypothetical protein